MSCSSSRILKKKKTNLIKPVFTSIRDIDGLDEFGLQPLVEHVRLPQLGLEVRTSGQNQTRYSHLGVEKFNKIDFLRETLSFLMNISTAISATFLT